MNPDDVLELMKDRRSIRKYKQDMINKAWQRFKIKLESKDLKDLTDNYPKFDLIIFAHSLEHMREPISVLEHSRGLLGDNGYIFIELPMSPLPSEADKDMLHDYLNSTHLYNFTQKSLQALAPKCSFNIVNISRYDTEIKK